MIEKKDSKEEQVWALSAAIMSTDYVQSTVFRVGKLKDASHIKHFRKCFGIQFFSAKI